VSKAFNRWLGAFLKGPMAPAWFPISIDELGSLVSDGSQVEVWMVAKELGFKILASWQGGRMYVRVTAPDGHEQTYETSMVWRRPSTITIPNTGASQ
jgi:hypothetical protein